MRPESSRLRAGVFDPETIASLTAALDDMCCDLEVSDDDQERRILAEWIIELARDGKLGDVARDGEVDRTRLRQRVFSEVAKAAGVLELQ
jgi:hypothetical protein